MIRSFAASTCALYLQLLAMASEHYKLLNRISLHNSTLLYAWWEGLWTSHNKQT